MRGRHRAALHDRTGRRLSARRRRTATVPTTHRRQRQLPLRRPAARRLRGQGDVQRGASHDVLTPATRRPATPTTSARPAQQRQPDHDAGRPRPRRRLPERRLRLPADRRHDLARSATRSGSTPTPTGRPGRCAGRRQQRVRHPRRHRGADQGHQRRRRVGSRRRRQYPAAPPTTSRSSPPTRRTPDGQYLFRAWPCRLTATALTTTTSSGSTTPTTSWPVCARPTTRTAPLDNRSAHRARRGTAERPDPGLRLHGRAARPRPRA